MPVPKPSDAHDSEHVHGEVCKTVMSIRDTTIDDGVTTLEALLQREYERGRLAELDRLEPSCMLWVRYDGGYYGQDHAERIAEIKAKGENHGE